MPTLTTTEYGEIRVHHRQVTRMSDRLWRLGSPARRTAYVEKARQRLAAGPARHSDAAIVLAAGDERALVQIASTSRQSLLRRAEFRLEAPRSRLQVLLDFERRDVAV